MKLKIDLTGRTFDRLTVQGRSTKIGQAPKWNCKCACGGACKPTTWNLVHGKSRSCGCLRRDNNGGHHLRPYEALYNVLISKRRKYEVVLSYEEFVDFTKTTECHYCLAPIDWTKKERYNLDRTNSRLGYSKKNCVVCCTRCNLGKNNRFTYEEWYEMTECLRRKVCQSNLDQVCTMPKLTPNLSSPLHRQDRYTRHLRRFPILRINQNNKRSSEQMDKSIKYPQN